MFQLQSENINILGNNMDMEFCMQIAYAMNFHANIFSFAKEFIDAKITK